MIVEIIIETNVLINFIINFVNNDSWLNKEGIKKKKKKKTQLEHVEKCFVSRRASETRSIQL